MVSFSDGKLVEMFNSGDEGIRTSAFEEIVRRYQKKVYNTTYRMMGNPEDANDLAFRKHLLGSIEIYTVFRERLAFLHGYLPLHPTFVVMNYVNVRED